MLRSGGSAARSSARNHRPTARAVMGLPMGAYRRPRPQRCWSATRRPCAAGLHASQAAGWALKSAGPAEVRPGRNECSW
jgi:hypothetical protein